MIPKKYKKMLDERASTTLLTATDEELRQELVRRENLRIEQENKEIQKQHAFTSVAAGILINFVPKEVSEHCRASSSSCECDYCMLKELIRDVTADPSNNAVGIADVVADEKVLERLANANYYGLIAEVRLRRQSLLEKKK